MYKFMGRVVLEEVKYENFRPIDTCCGYAYTRI